MPTHTSTLMSDRSRRFRIVLVIMSSTAWLAAFMLIASQEWGHFVPVLVLVGGLWRLMAHCWPEKWVPGNA